MYIHYPEMYLSEVYAFTVSVMYKHKLLFVAHQQVLLCQDPFISVQGSIPLPQPPRGRETAHGFLREETSKQCLTRTLQPCPWHFPSTCTSLDHEYLLSIVVGICQSKEDQRHPAANLFPLPWSCCGASLAASAQPLAPTCVSSAHPTALDLLLSQYCWDPKPEQQSRTQRFAKAFLIQAIKYSQPPHPSKASRGGTLLRQCTWGLADTLPIQVFKIKLGMSSQKPRFSSDRNNELLYGNYWMKV